VIAELILKWAVPFVCGGCITWCITYMKMRKRHDRALENGVQCLLRGELIRDYKEYSHKGYCPIYGKEAVKRAYTAYHALGGNDVVTEMYEKMLKMPTEPQSQGEQGEE